jgi:hypothetical protein
VHLNHQEHLETVLQQGRQVLQSLDRSSQSTLLRTIDQYEKRWKDLRERWNRSLTETGKPSRTSRSHSHLSCRPERIHQQATNLLQNCDAHLKSCTNFMSRLIAIDNDPTRTSKDKLEKLKVNSRLASRLSTRVLSLVERGQESISIAEHNPRQLLIVGPNSHAYSSQ